MSAKIPNFNDRMKASAGAKQAIAEKFRSKPKPTDPEIQQRLIAQAAIAAAREIRLAERKAAKEAEAARLRAEKIAKEAVEATRQKEELARLRALAAEQKAARDARYAARKARR
ncbi:MAG: hypothetical protein EXR09_00880 [Acetobacteraceae bacterium]|nr:hypothetical protein [Acetobacteraceae bacterium]